MNRHCKFALREKAKVDDDPKTISPVAGMAEMISHGGPLTKHTGVMAPGQDIMEKELGPWNLERLSNAAPEDHSNRASLQMAQSQGNKDVSTAPP